MTSPQNLDTKAKAVKETWASRAVNVLFMSSQANSSFPAVDDDTYVIVENLLHFLSDKNQSEPVYFGQTFKPFVKQGYNSGGAGYVLSKEALRRLCERDDAEKCIKTNTDEDVEMGRCLESLDVRIGESLDQFGKTRFHGFPLQTVMDSHCDTGYESYDYYNCSNKGWQWLSDYAVTFHYISPINMFQLDYFIYRLRPFGVFNRLVV
ncbi:glycoprotein-N-acetylgalactosamine 3-beta-galactosyltransferase 1-like [Physella acuta]|uniref:glycoprotein-N-acetylgalactosamine 3-beta-galactosyltransferase 1-like n=1 Tax=Physella acuta TaxID=109671 RepID=UPI0027DD2BB3|nr:glycoprotein-N-acetylgalactosamine 3-beta-galactosyltransferase 1-like [Physella acuta]